jgi:hypothetical protein
MKRTPRKSKNGKRLGRPPKPVPQDLADEVIAWVSAGKMLCHYCAQEGKPGRTTVWEWMQKDDDFRERFARAREDGCHAIAEEAIDIADTKPGTFSDLGGSERIDPGSVQWQRVRIDSRLKLLACWLPSVYGTKARLEHSGGVTLNVTTGVPEE